MKRLRMALRRAFGKVFNVLYEWAASEELEPSDRSSTTAQVTLKPSSVSTYIRPVKKCRIEKEVRYKC